MASSLMPARPASTGSSDFDTARWMMKMEMP